MLRCYRRKLNGHSNAGGTTLHLQKIGYGSFPSVLQGRSANEFAATRRKSEAIYVGIFANWVGIWIRGELSCTIERTDTARFLVCTAGSLRKRICGNMEEPGGMSRNHLSEIGGDLDSGGATLATSKYRVRLIFLVVLQSFLLLRL